MILWSVNQHKTQLKNFQNFQLPKKIVEPQVFFPQKNRRKKTRFFGQASERWDG